MDDDERRQIYWKEYQESIARRFPKKGQKGWGKSSFDDTLTELEQEKKAEDEARLAELEDQLPSFDDIWGKSEEETTKDNTTKDEN